MKEKNKNFLFGVITAVAVIAVIGWLMNIVGDKDDTRSNDYKKEQVQQVDQKNDKNSKITVSEEDHIRGDANAPVTVIEFSDFQCPYCARFHETMLQAMDKYPTKIKWVYKHFPLSSIHSQAQLAAEASECAAEQGNFWEFADEVVKRQSSLSRNTFGEVAQMLNLDTSQFDNCVASGKYKSKVQADYALGLQNGVNGTPGLFINGKFYRGAISLSQLEQIVNSN